MFFIKAKRGFAATTLVSMVLSLLFWAVPAPAIAASAPPQIYHFPPYSMMVHAGESLDINANVTDDVGLSQVALKYKVGQSQSEFSTAMMEDQGFGNYKATIPGEFITQETGVDYFFVAADTDGPPNVTFLPSPEAQPPFFTAVPQPPQDTTPPTVTGATAYTNRMIINFSEDLADYTARNQSNYVLESPLGNEVLLTDRNWINYRGDIHAVEFGNLELTEGDAFKITARNVSDNAYPSPNTIEDNGTTNVAEGTVQTSIDPYLDTVSPPVGRAGSQITISGLRFGADAGSAHLCGQEGCNNDLIIDSWSDTLITATIPEIGVGQYGINVQNADTRWSANGIQFQIISESQSVATGRVVEPDGQTGVANANVGARPAQGEGGTGTQTQNDGSFAIVFDSAGDYLLNVNPPYGSMLSAPAEMSFSLVTGEMKDLGNITLLEPQITGVVKVPSGVDPDIAVANSGVQLHAKDYNKNIWRCSNTNEAGQFSFGGLEDGVYILRAEPPYMGDSGYSSSLEMEVTITDGQPISDLVLRLSQPNLVGTVVKPDQSPAAMANVNVNSNNFWTGSQTNQDGQFKLFVKDGEYEITAWPSYMDQGLSSSVKHKITFAGGVLVKMDGQDFSGDLVLALTEPNVRGVVKDPTGENPIPNTHVSMRTAEVSSKGATGPMEQRWYDTQTDSQGAFSFGGVEDGNYVLRADAPWGSSYAPGEVEIAVIDGRANMESFEILLALPNVSGTVVDPDGNPVNNSGVAIHDDKWNYNQWNQTGEGGTFGFSVPDGTYKIRAEAPYGSQFSAARELDVVVAEGVVTSPEGSIVLQLTSPNVFGEIHPPLGVEPDSGVSQIGVGLHTQDWAKNYWSGTNDAGQFSFGNVDPGNYILEINPPWSSDYMQTQINVVISEGANDLGIVRFASPQVVGRLLMPDGETPISWTGLSIHPAFMPKGGMSSGDAGQWRWTQTNEQGKFSFGGLTAGTYQIEFQPSWNAQGLIPPDPMTIDISDTPQDLGDILFVQAQKHITGVITRGDASPIANVGVNAWQESGMGWTDTYTNENGEYTLDVSGGNWQIMLHPRYDLGEVDWYYSAMPTSVSFAKDNSEETKTADFVVQSANSTVIGTIIDPDGNAEQGWVDIRSQDGKGSGASTDNNGRFSVKVPAGTFKVAVYAQDNTLNAPEISPFSIKDGEIKDLGTIQLVSRNEHIKGIVVDSLGNPLSGTNVNAFKYDGQGWATATTDSTGSFDLLAGIGRWGVFVQPSAEQYVANVPPQDVTLVQNETKEGVNFTLQIADAQLSGNLTDSDGNPLSNIYGFAWAEEIMVQQQGGPAGDSMMFKPSYGGPINGGTFSFRLPGGKSYRVGVGIGSGTEYFAPAPETVEVASGETTTHNIILSSADATITGHLTDKDGNPITGVWAEVFAAHPEKGYQPTIVDTTDGSFTLKVASGTWYVGANIDPASGYTSPMPEEVAVETGANSYDVVLEQTNAQLHVHVTDPDGNGMGGTWVWADAKSDGKGGQGYGAPTDDMGTATVYVTAGDYVVGAFAPQEFGFIPPAKTDVSVGEGGSQDVELAFRNSDATISGNITLDSAPNPAYVWAWSENGGYANINSTDGTYSLSVAGDDTWHLGAVYDNGSSVWKSNEQIVELGESENAEVNLELLSTNTQLPDVENVTFNANEMKVIELSDGTKITIPAGAIETSGEVMVVVSPKTDLQSQDSARPIGIGYNFEAFQNGQKITHSFYQNVMIQFPYTDEQLQAAGIAEDQLSAAYWNETNGTWMGYPSAVIDTLNNLITVMTDHFTDFGILNTGNTPVPTATNTPTNTPTRTPTNTPTRTSTPLPTNTPVQQQPTNTPTLDQGDRGSQGDQGGDVTETARATSTLTPLVIAKADQTILPTSTQIPASLGQPIAVAQAADGTSANTSGSSSLPYVLGGLVAILLGVGGWFLFKPR